MANKVEGDKTGKEGLLQEGVHNSSESVDENVNLLIEEINCVLKRNKTEKFLKKVLTRVLVLEELQ